MATRAELFEALKTKAGHGDPEAMLELAVTLGRSDPGSHVWIQRAAEAGLPRAHASLGWAYEKGFHGLLTIARNRGNPVKFTSEG